MDLPAEMNYKITINRKKRLLNYFFLMGPSSIITAGQTAGSVLWMCLCFMTHGETFPCVSQHCSLLLQFRIRNKSFPISMEIKKKNIYFQTSNILSVMLYSWLTWDKLNSGFA